MKDTKGYSTLYYCFAGPTSNDSDYDDDNDNDNDK